MRRIKIGPSNGWFYANGSYNVQEQIRLLKSIGVEAMELALAGWGSEENDRRITSLDEAIVVNKFPFLSIHAPDYSDSIPPRKQVIKLTELTATHMPNVVLIHPLMVEGGDYPYDYYESIISGEVPLAIENMDKDKDSGFLIRDLLGITGKIGLKFVFDIQHAFEHDSSMKYAQDLFEAMKDKISHFHVSGETANNHHSLLHKARNVREILDFLCWAYGQLKEKPSIILEGEYRGMGEIEAEITLLKNNLYTF